MQLCSQNFFLANHSGVRTEFIMQRQQSAGLPTAIITGASAGIGRAIAIALAKRGQYRLCLIARKRDKLRETQDLCLAENPRIDVVVKLCDMRYEPQVTRVFENVCAELAPIHVLVNNAGVFNTIPLLSQVDGENWDTILNVNLRASIQGTRVCAPFIVQAAKANANGKTKSSSTPCAIISIASILGTDIGVGVYFRTVADLQIEQRCASML